MPNRKLGTIRNRFKILLSEKEATEGHRISYSAIRSETGISVSTLSSLAGHKRDRYDGGTIAALCHYFQCDVGQLLEYVPPQESKPAKRVSMK